MIIPNANYYFFYENSSLPLSYIPSSEKMINEYDAMYQQSIQSLKNATNVVITKEQEIQALKAEIQKLKV